MTVNLAQMKLDLFERANALLEEQPAAADAFRVGPESLARAAEWFDDPLFSPHAGDARRATEFVANRLGSIEGQRFSAFYNRVARANPVAPFETRWQAEAKNPILARAKDAATFEAQWSAVDIVAFLQRISADLYAYSATPYFPLYNRARVLIHRLWSAERRDDQALPADLRSWLKDIDLILAHGTLDAHLDEATLVEYGHLPDLELLAELRQEHDDGFAPEFFTEGLTIDSGWLLLGRDKRFAAFAAPLVGMMILVDAWRPKGSAPWESSFYELFPEGHRMPSQEGYRNWIEPWQDLLATARDLKAAGLMSVQAEIPVRLRGRQQTAIVESFHDFAHWYHATKSLDDFGVQFERIAAPLAPDLVIGHVTDAYLRLAEAGYLSLDPQYFVHRQTGEVKLAQLRSIFPMKEFPFEFFVDSVASTLVEKFGLHGERARVREEIRRRVLDALGAGRLLAYPPADLPAAKRATPRKAGDGEAADPSPRFTGVIDATPGQAPADPAAPAEETPSGAVDAAIASPGEAAAAPGSQNVAVPPATSVLR